MTATDDLRSMLDERGIKWKADTSVINGVVWTIWKSPWFGETWAKELDGSISLFNCSMTPAQAIEATLGRGECRRVLYEPTGMLVCSECGAGIPKQLDKYCYLHYCPDCGRSVKA